jgi:hypothetical protein
MTPEFERSMTHALDRATAVIGKLYSSPNAIRVIKSRTLRQEEHVAGMGEMNA